MKQPQHNTALHRRAFLRDSVGLAAGAALNLDLSRAVAHLGLHYAPDPSSQQSCSIGGNVATNSGGPHCLLYGVTSLELG